MGFIVKQTAAPISPLTGKGKALPSFLIYNCYCRETFERKTHTNNLPDQDEKVMHRRRNNLPSRCNIPYCMPVTVLTSRKYAYISVIYRTFPYRSSPQNTT
jgi:hypothetical protein